MQSGFLLVTAIFLLVVLAALGAFILTISGTQQTSSALDVQGARAYQAARAGIDWASYQLLISTGGAIAFDAFSDEQSGPSAVPSLTFPHTVGAGGTNRILVVAASFFDAATPMVTVSSITYAGQSLTMLAEKTNATNRIRSEMWYRIAPATGANNIVVTFSENAKALAAGRSYTNVHQTTPFGAVATADGGNSAPSVAVSSATGELVVDTVGIRQNVTGDQTLTVGANQVQRYNTHSAAGQGEFHVKGAGSEEAGAASVTMSWTQFTTSDAEVWGIIAAPLRPGPSAFTTLCNPGPTTQDVTGMGGTLSGFTATVTCSSTTYTEAGATVTVYQITSTGAQGTVGTLDRVERQLQVTLNK